MSNKVFVFSLLGQTADIVITEVALANGLHESNPLMRLRGIRIPVKIALPVVAKLLSRNIPRDDANTVGIIIGVSGFAPATWNVIVTIKGH